MTTVGRLAAGWLGGWLIIWMADILWTWDPGFMGMNLTSF